MSYTKRERRQIARARKAMLRSLQLCICGPAHTGPSRRTGIVHGPVVRAGKCARCNAVHDGWKPSPKPQSSGNGTTQEQRN